MKDIMRAIIDGWTRQRKGHIPSMLFGDAPKSFGDLDSLTVR